jgi:hypothetical protein
MKRPIEEIAFLSMVMERLKSMPAEEYKLVSEKLEIIGRKARELR